MTGFTGGNTVIHNLNALNAKMKATIQAKLEDAGQMTLDEATASTPVLTGYLQSRNQIDVQPGEVTVFNDASYSIYVELGTSKMAAEPFLVPAFLDASDWVQGELNNLLP